MSASFRQDPPHLGRRSSDDRYRNDGYGRDRDSRAWEPRSRDRAEDRDRERFPDSSPRDRERERERGREWHSVDTSVNHARQENSATTPSMMGSTGDSPHRDRKTPAHEISAVFGKYGDILAERSSLKSQEAALEKLMKQKKAEYDKSLPKHAEYPSVPELHKKWRDSNERDRANLDRLLRANQEAYNQATDAIANSLLQGLPAEMQSRVSQGPIPKADYKEVDSKMGMLKGQLQNQINQNQNNFKNGLAKQAEQVELLQTELSRQEDRFKKELESQSLLFREEMEKQRDSFRKELERQRDEFGKEIAKQQGGSSQKVDALQEENSALRRRLDDLSHKFEESRKEVTGLHGQLLAQNQTLRETQTMVDDHSKKLADFVVEELREAMEGFCFKLPAVITTQAEHKTEIEGLMQSRDQVDSLKQASAQYRQEINDLKQVQRQLDGLKEAQDLVIHHLGGMINDLREKDQGQEGRIVRLEEKVVDSGAAAHADVVLRGQKVEKLEQELVSSKAVIDDLEKKSDGLSLQVSTLDSQYNNLMTTSMADLVITQLQRIYPNYMQQISELDAVHNRLKAVEEELNNMKAVVEKLNNMQSALDRAIQSAEAPARNLQDGPAGGPEHHHGQFVKKRKLESGGNTEQAAQVTNGHR